MRRQRRVLQSRAVSPTRGMLCRRCYVSGRVQGVFYRASTREEARRLGVTGYARNLPDGRVEVLACGEPSAVQSLCDWLLSGPPAARVSDVHCETVSEEVPGEFLAG